MSGESGKTATGSSAAIGAHLRRGRRKTARTGFLSRREFLALQGCLVAGAAFGGVAAPDGEPESEAADELPGAARAFVDAVPPRTRALLSAILTPAQLRKTYLVLADPEAHGSLGPRPGYRPDLSRKPAYQAPLPTEGAEGSGSSENPWRGAIAQYLARFRFPREPKAFRVAEWGTVDPAEIEQYMARLPYAAVAVRLPPGHYVEDALSLPPGVWLVAERDAHLHVAPPGERAEPAAAFIQMGTRSGLIGLEVDGANITDFVPDPPYKVNAVVLRHSCEVHGCYIHHWPGSGLRADGKRSRESNWCSVTGNVIERVGYSGARIGSRTVFENNEVRYCGLLRPTGGGGDDGVIASYSDRAVIANNLVVGRKMPHGRHVISGQRPRRTKVLGNISIAEGPMRNNVGFSDGAHFNEFVGNVLLGLGAGGSIQAGIANSGYGGVIRHNASIGNTRAFRNRSSRCMQGEAPAPPSKIMHNYGEYQRSGVHRSSCYVAEGNDLVKSREHLPLDVDYEEFGFFAWA